MISTSVKDVGSVMSVVAPSSSTANSSTGSGVSFQSVLDNQTNKDALQQPKTEDSAKVNESDSTDTYEQPKVEKDTAPSNVKDTSKSDDVVDTTEAQDAVEEVDEEVLEVLGSATYELMQQIAEVFGVSVEEVQGIMETLGMNEMELLNPDKLGELFLTMSGSNDSLALLTNEKLYSDYQKLMEQLQSLMQECSETLEMEPEQLNQLVDDMLAQQAQDVITEEMPVIEVEILETPQDDSADTVYVHKTTESDIYGGAGAVTVATPESNQDAGQSMESSTQQENPFAQNLMNQQQNVQGLEQVSQTYTSWDVDTQEIMKQVMDYMKIQVGPETTDIEMRLTPENLGTLHVQVASKGGVLTANFITENETVKAVLESQMIQLKETFAEQGVKVEAIEVTVQTHAFERNLEQGRGRQQEDTSKKNKTRRINLNEPLDTELVEEEEQLVAEMMAANGSTVDYTV